MPIDTTAERDAYQAHTRRCMLCNRGHECRTEAALFKAWGDKLRGEEHLDNLRQAPSNYDTGAYLRAIGRHMTSRELGQVILDQAGQPSQLIFRGKHYRVVDT